jgi:hypothetical protein
MYIRCVSKFNRRREINNTVDTTKTLIICIATCFGLVRKHKPNGGIFKGTINISSARNEISIFKLFACLFTYSMKQNPSWDINSFSVSQEISCTYGTRNFITAVTSAHDLSLSWSFSIQPTHHMPLHKNPSYLIWDFQMYSFLLLKNSATFPHQKPVYANSLPHTRYMLRLSNFSRFYHLNNNYAPHYVVSYTPLSLRHC